MSITIKMMSNQALPDSDNSKDFDLVVVGDGYSLSFVNHTGSPVLALTGNSGSTTHRRVHGNVYIMNDQGKTIATYQYKNICEEVNVNVQLGKTMAKLDLDSFVMAFEAATNQPGEFIQNMATWMAANINASTDIRDVVEFAMTKKQGLPKNENEALNLGRGGAFAKDGTKPELAELQNKAAATAMLSKHLGQLSPTDLATDVSGWSEENISKFVFGLLMKKPKEEKAAIVRQVQKFLEDDVSSGTTLDADVSIGHQLGDLEFGNATVALWWANEQSKKTYPYVGDEDTAFHKALGEYMANMAGKGDKGVIAALKYAASYIPDLPKTLEIAINRGRGGKFAAFGTPEDFATAQNKAVASRRQHNDNPLIDQGYLGKPVRQWNVADIESFLNSFAREDDETSLFYALESFLKINILSGNNPSMNLILKLFDSAQKRVQRGESGIAQPMYPG